MACNTSENIDDYPFVYVLNKGKKESYCDFCFSKREKTFSCPNCELFHYCNRDCKHANLFQHKSIECENLSLCKKKEVLDSFKDSLLILFVRALTIFKEVNFLLF
ncbi:unnamed protein product [Brachionus calyciflorus]|uniref:MYND-type domain-containing protein n=1 Tax=Brachionus calyciflorus TaxID=104777 RepID=A0A814QRF8_9BILA|nr:unnamed protein product [Brachionus calyciflorus]